MKKPTTCTTPPSGWTCSREAGHTGPCAATQDTPAALSVEMHAALCPAHTGGNCTCEKFDPAVDKAWAQFCAGIGDGPNAPYPGMIAAFERYYSQSFADKAWRSEAATWAAAWKAAMQAPVAGQPAEPSPADSALWAVNVHGPDDLYAMPSRAAALEHANELNIYFGEHTGKHEYDPVMRAVVITWEGSAESHAEDLRTRLAAPKGDSNG